MVVSPSATRRMAGAQHILAPGRRRGCRGGLALDDQLMDHSVTVNLVDTGAFEVAGLSASCIRAAFGLREGSSPGRSATALEERQFLHGRRIGLHAVRTVAAHESLTDDAEQ